MSKLKTKFTFGLLTLALILVGSFGMNAALPTGADVSDTPTVVADTSLPSEVATINLKNRVGGGNSGITENGGRFVAAWQDINKVEITFNADKAADLASKASTFNYEFRAEYSQSTATTSNPTFHTIDAIVKSEEGKNVTLDQIGTFTYYFDVNEDDKEFDLSKFEEQIGSKIHKDYGFGWGIYRFTIRIGLGDQQIFHAWTSPNIFIEPSRPDVAPEIEEKEKSSVIGLQNAYLFGLKDESEYMYADQSKIKWYVEGEGMDGTKYVLTKEDTKLAKYNGWSYIFESEQPRNGLSFKFDSKIDGKWTVYCIYDNGTANGLTSNTRSVTIGNELPASILIWIIIAAAVVLLAVVVIIIVVAKKKEKVW